MAEEDWYSLRVEPPPEMEPAGALQRQWQPLSLEIEDAMVNGGNICQKLKEHEEQAVENQISGNNDLKTTLANCLFSCFIRKHLLLYLHSPFLDLLPQRR